MPTFREAKPTMAVDLDEYAAVFVGVQIDTSTVEVIWVRHEGAMSLWDHTFRPSLGRTAVGESITTFGLSRLHRFPVSALNEAHAYAARLKRELEDDAPQDLETDGKA